MKRAVVAVGLIAVAGLCLGGFPCPRCLSFPRKRESISCCVSQDHMDSRVHGACHSRASGNPQHSLIHRIKWIPVVTGMTNWPLDSRFHGDCHSRAGGNPLQALPHRIWIPVVTGMTKGARSGNAAPWIPVVTGMTDVRSQFSCSPESLSFPRRRESISCLCSPPILHEATSARLKG